MLKVTTKIYVKSNLFLIRNERERERYGTKSTGLRNQNETNFRIPVIRETIT